MLWNNLMIKLFFNKQHYALLKQAKNVVLIRHSLC